MQKYTTNNNHERENYSWWIIQEMIEREVHKAFKIRKKSEKRLDIVLGFLYNI